MFWRNCPPTQTRNNALSLTRSTMNETVLSTSTTNFIVLGHHFSGKSDENLNSCVDEEGRSRQRILTFAARRYASAIERNPEDYDALYNWALVLQESAANVATDSTSPSKDDLFEEACKKYDEATRLCPTLHDVISAPMEQILERLRAFGEFEGFSQEYHNQQRSEKKYNERKKKEEKEDEQKKNVETSKEDEEEVHEEATTKGNDDKQEN